MSPFAARSVVVVLLVAIGAGFAIAQTSDGPKSSTDIAGFSCGDVSLLPVANQAALIYYIAGYRDGVAASANLAAASSAEEPRRQAPVLNLDARRIIRACADAPESRLADLIVADDGGAGGMGAVEASLGLDPSSSSSIEPRVIVIRETPDTPDTTATDAVSANLRAASEALQDSINRPPFVAPIIPP